MKNINLNVFDDSQNKVIVVDPGHGGIDGGAGKSDPLEKDINLAISKKLKACLESRGYRVILTRERDVSLDSLCTDGGGRHLKDLKARVDIVNSSNAQLFISIHGNYYLKNPDADGSIVLYSDKFPQNEDLAYCIQRALNRIVIDGKKRTVHSPVKTSTLYLLNYSSIPGVMVETAFLTNARENELLMKDSFREQIAEAITDGIEKYLSDTKNVYKFK